jgi:hypothetical protein
VTDGIARREFLAAATAAGAIGAPSAGHASQASASGSIGILVEDASLMRGAGAWGTERLVAVLRDRGLVPIVRQGTSMTADHIVRIRLDPRLGIEDVEIALAASAGESILSSGGPRGIAYGLSELAERLDAEGDPLVALRRMPKISDKPYNRVRSILRAFCSDVEDKSWFYDREEWKKYLDHLVASRFNRFQLAFGFGYDFPTNVTEDYFHFPYPYLVDVPGYDVRVQPLESGERERNLETLKFITQETGKRGLEFQLGLWTHAYQWTDSPSAHHKITGLTPDTHAAYCRDALALLLKTCPDISGLTMRVHGESGVPEGQYDFWKTLFSAISQCGRPMEIDMHAKGINQTMIDIAVATGKAVKVSPKYSAEHQGLGYQQADIRSLEVPAPGAEGDGPFSLSNGARMFTRYSYADLFQEGRKYEVLFRRWPGTQRHTLNGDPAQASAYGRTSAFCGAAGLEICEPLTFKGRDGSGNPGGRLAYLNNALVPAGGDWSKFRYSYLLWGRTLYDPDVDAEAWRRLLRRSFGDAVLLMEQAMGEASRILLIFTSSHLSTASNRGSWYETYTNMPIVIGSEPAPYHDTPAPFCAGTVSPLDPQLFSSAREHVEDILAGRHSPRYSPVEVATWLQRCADTASTALEQARGRVASRLDPEFRRWEEDILIQIGLGRFFADKFRATVLYELFLRTGEGSAGKQALVLYRQARDQWATMSDRAKSVYIPDVSYGVPDFERWHWAARLPAIDRDLAAMASAIDQVPANRPVPTAVGSAVAAAMAPVERVAPACHHRPAARFQEGEPLSIVAEVSSPVLGMTLWYRHVNQGERWQSAPMQAKGGDWHGVIGGDYTQSPFPLQYYFVVTSQNGSQDFHPLFDRTQSNEPYFTVWKRGAARMAMQSVPIGSWSGIMSVK